MTVSWHYPQQIISMKKKRSKHSKLYNFIKKRGFTDKLYFANLTFAWCFTVACFILTIFSGKLGIMDMSIVSVGMGVVWVELGTHTAFIIRKAEKENLNKHREDEQ